PAVPVEDPLPCGEVLGVLLVELDGFGEEPTLGRIARGGRRPRRIAFRHGGRFLPREGQEENDEEDECGGARARRDLYLFRKETDFVEGLREPEGDLGDDRLAGEERLERVGREPRGRVAV